MRSRRALRGRGGAEHPRVAILGLLEARLQSFDTRRAGRPGRGRLAAGDRSRPVDEPADAHRRRARLAGGARRPDGARLRHAGLRRAETVHPVLPAPARRRARGAGALAGAAGGVPCRARRDARPRIRRRAGPACWTSRTAARPPVQPPRAPPARRRCARAAQRDRDRDLAARPLRDLRQARAAPARARPARAVRRRRRLRHHRARRRSPPSSPSCRHRLPAPTPPPAARARWTARWTSERCARRWPPGGARACTASPTGWPRPRSGRRRDDPGRWSRCEADGEWQVAPAAEPFVLTGRADRIERRPTARSPCWTTRPAPCRTQPTSRRATRRNCRWRPRWPPAARSARARRRPAAELAYWRLTGGFVPGEVVGCSRRTPGRHPRQGGRGGAAASPAWSPPSTTRRSPISRSPSRPPRRASPITRQLARVAEWALLEDEAMIRRQPPARDQRAARRLGPGTSRRSWRRPPGRARPSC